VSVSSVPGFDVLGLNDNGTPAASSSSATPAPQTPTQTQTQSSPPQSSSSSATQNPYQQAYDSIETWSASYLMQAIEYGAPAIPQYTAGQSVDAMAALTNTLAAIQPGVENGTYGDGTGSNVNATA
jgi:hypothetical protein